MGSILAAKPSAAFSPLSGEDSTLAIFGYNGEIPIDSPASPGQDNRPSTRRLTRRRRSSSPPKVPYAPLPPTPTKEIAGLSEMVFGISAQRSGSTLPLPSRPARLDSVFDPGPYPYLRTRPDLEAIRVDPETWAPNQFRPGRKTEESRFAITEYDAQDR